MRLIWENCVGCNGKSWCFRTSLHLHSFGKLQRKEAEEKSQAEEKQQTEGKQGSGGSWYTDIPGCSKEKTPEEDEAAEKRSGFPELY